MVTDLADDLVVPHSGSHMPGLIMIIHALLLHDLRYYVRMFCYITGKIILQAPKEQV